MHDRLVTTAPPIPTIPPINIPTVPPINIPTIPPINIPGVTIPPINIPGVTIPPIILPGFSIPAGAVTCPLVTAAEVTQIMGAPVTDTSDSATSCSFTSQSFSVITVGTDSTSDLSGVQFLMGSTAQQSTIGGFPAISGTVLGQPAVYVQKPGSQLSVLGVFAGTDPSTLTKLQQIATLAVSRMP